MAHSYTPGLTVTEHTTVRRRRMLSLPGTVLVATGETVRANQAVARAELPGKVYPLNLANQLGVAPDEIHEYLIKKAGDPVQKDEILAQNKPLIKWLKTEVLSPVTGVVESVSSVTGQVLLREPPRVLELLGYVDGRIVEVIPQQGVVVETDCSLVQGIFGIGGETRGEIMIAVTSPDEALTPRHLTADMKGKVVVGGSFISSDALAAFMIRICAPCWATTLAWPSRVRNKSALPSFSPKGSAPSPWPEKRSRFSRLMQDSRLLFQAPRKFVPASFVRRLSFPKGAQRAITVQPLSRSGKASGSATWFASFETRCSARSVKSRVCRPISRRFRLRVTCA